MKPRWLWLLVLIFGGWIASAPARADVPCAGTTCPPNNLCLDRDGAGEACYKLCPYGNGQCDSGCCLRISKPYFAWICGTAEECQAPADTDETDTAAASDGDAEAETVETAAGASCEPGCTSLQLCVKLDTNRTACAAICAAPSDCDSGCCALTAEGKAVCLPKDVPCPQTQPESSGNNSGVSCGSQTGPADGFPWLFLLAAAYAATRLMKRHAARRRLRA